MEFGAFPNNWRRIKVWRSGIGCLCASCQQGRYGDCPNLHMCGHPDDTVELVDVVARDSPEEDVVVAEDGAYA